MYNKRPVPIKHQSQIDVRYHPRNCRLCRSSVKNTKNTNKNVYFTETAQYV